LKNQEEKTFYILKIKTKASSGTYMRVLASEIGQDLETEAVA
jgi:tRNA U55 pseudouridine synthase TruB